MNYHCILVEWISLQPNTQIFKCCSTCYRYIFSFIPFFFPGNSYNRTNSFYRRVIHSQAMLNCNIFLVSSPFSPYFMLDGLQCSPSRHLSYLSYNEQAADDLILFMCFQSPFLQTNKWGAGWEGGWELFQLPPSSPYLFPSPYLTITILFGQHEETQIKYSLFCLVWLMCITACCTPCFHNLLELTGLPKL